MHYCQIAYGLYAIWSLNYIKYLLITFVIRARWAGDTGGSCLSQIFWEHEILSGLSVIWLIYIKLYKEKEIKMSKILD